MTQKELNNLPPTQIKTNVSGETAKNHIPINACMVLGGIYTTAILIIPAFALYHLFYKNGYTLSTNNYIAGYMAILAILLIAYGWNYRLLFPDSSKKTIFGTEERTSLSIGVVVVETIILYKYCLWVFNSSVPETPVQLAFNMIAFPIIIVILLYLVPIAIAMSSNHSLW